MSAPVDLEEMRWHALPSNEIARILDVELAGLSAQDVNRQAARFGPNALPTPSRRNPLLRFLAQFNHTLIYVLLAGAPAAALLTHIIIARPDERRVGEVGLRTMNNL